MHNKQSFESLWSRHLEPKAKAHGVRDGDVSKVRTAVKNLLVTAGWADQNGATSFGSIKDFNACLSAATQTIDRVAPPLAAERKLTTVRAGFTPTKSQMLAGSAVALPAATGEWTPVTLESVPEVQVAAVTFSPLLAKLGDKCPRCSGSMQPVALVNDRAALYCNRDRVVLPLPPEQTMRDDAC